MYKEKLQGVITERYLDGKINTDRYIRLMEKTESITEGKSLDLLTEITSRTWDELWITPVGAKIKVALNAKYKSCKSGCIGDDPGRKNYCVEKCRHAYYNALERNRARINKD